jgi:cellulose synthase/poly-beta-1,6-N-acetylglucosamine synthase-like glycosyltransferase
MAGIDVAILAFAAVCAGIVVWVYFGYPLTLLVLAAVRPRPRRRAPVELPVTVVVAAHQEAGTIGGKVADVRSTDYPAELLEVIVASDGSTDGTVAEAQAAGADRVLDLPRVGKIAALEAAVEIARGEVLVFTDADATWTPASLPALMTAFADPQVGGVSCEEISRVAEGSGTESIGRGEGLYWRYEQWIKRLEDRVGSTVSASGRLYAVRRALFTGGYMAASTDDFAISTAIRRTGHRLAFEPHAVVFTDGPSRAVDELRRKVRLMNRGLRGALGLGSMLNPLHGGGYAIQVLSHKILRRLVPFFLLGLLAAGVWLTVRHQAGWILLAPQLAFYALATLGWAGRCRAWGRVKPLYVPYYFCVANLAAALAVISLARGVRFETWQPQRT